MTTLNGKLDAALGTQTAALTLRAQRQQMIASNIANADTPGYKALDFNFTTAMRTAIATHGGASIVTHGGASIVTHGGTAIVTHGGTAIGTQGGTAAQPPAAALMRVAAVPAQTAPGHMAGLPSAYAGISTQYRMPAQPAADGNSVDMDLERARFAENSVRYEAALRFLNGQIKTLQSAIQG